MFRVLKVLTTLKPHQTGSGILEISVCYFRFFNVSSLVALTPTGISPKSISVSDSSRNLLHVVVVISRKVTSAEASGYYFCLK